MQLEEPLTPDTGDGWGSALDGRIEQQPWMLPGKPPRAQPEKTSVPGFATVALLTAATRPRAVPLTVVKLPPM